MNIDPNVGRVWVSPELEDLQELMETGEIDEAKLSVLESEELTQSTLEASEAKGSENYTDFGSPVLTAPNYDVIKSAEEKGVFAPEDLTDDVIKNYLDDFSGFASFPAAQNFISESDILDSVRQILLENPGSPYSAEALAATALAQRMHDVWSATGDSDVKEMWDTIRYDILKLNNPTAQVLIEAKARDLEAQGFSLEEAKQRAIEETLHDLDVELSENGVITPFYGTHPKMDAAIGALLAANFSDRTEAMDFVNSIQDLVGMEQNLINLFAGIQFIQQTSGTTAAEKAAAVQKNIINSAQQIIDEAMKTLEKLPLPENQKVAILDFMKKLSEALALLDRIMAEISMSEAQKAKAEFSSKVDAILTQLKSQLDALRKAMKEIKKAKKKAKKFAVIGKIMKIMNKVMAAVMMVGIILAIAFLLFMMPVMAPIAIIGIIGLVALFIGVVVSLALSETGELDKWMEGFFEIFYSLLTDVLGLDVSREAAGMIMVGVIGAIALLPILLSVLLLPLLLVLLPLILVLAPLMFGVVLIAFGVILLLAMLISLVLAPVVIQFLPEMILRSGLLSTLAQKIGKSMGMSEGQIYNLEAGLRGATAMITVSTGMNVSSSFGKISRDEQDLVNTEAKKRGELFSAESKQGRIAAYRNLGQVRTLNDLAAMQAASPEELEERQEELQEMLAILRKVIAQLKKLIAALMGGGDPSAIDSAISEIQSIIDSQMSGFISPSGQEIDVKSMIMPFVESTLKSIPNVLPSEEAIQEQLRKVQEKAGYESEEEQDYIRTNEILS